MDKTTRAANVAGGGAICWQKPSGAEPGSYGHNSLVIACPKEVNRPSPFQRAAKFMNDKKIHKIVAQVPWPIGVVQHTWEAYMGQPMVQKVPGTCVLVSCTMCVEAVHRLQHEKLQRKESTTSPFPFRASAPDDLFEACRTDGIWNPGVGAYVSNVLNKIREMGGVPAINATTLAQCFLPLRSWREHSGGLSPERVARLLHDDGPCIGLLWVSPWYHLHDADRDDTLVYTSGCGRSDDDARRKIEELHPGEVGWHAVVCFGYRCRFRDGHMDVLVLDNHTPTGPRRWIHIEEFHTIYTLSV